MRVRVSPTRHTSTACGVSAALNPRVISLQLVWVAPRRWSPGGLLKGAEPGHLWLSGLRRAWTRAWISRRVSRPGVRGDPAFLTRAQGPGEERCWRADTPGCCSCSWDCSCYGTSSACGPCPRGLYTDDGESGSPLRWSSRLRSVGRVGRRIETSGGFRYARVVRPHASRAPSTRYSTHARSAGRVGRAPLVE